MAYNYAIFQTNEISFLTSCIKTGSYGEGELCFDAPHFDVLKELRDLQIGDRVFIHLKARIFCGPFFITEPHPEFVVEKSVGCWHKVDIAATAPDCKPVWLALFPWCFFFDKELSLQVNYCYASLLLKVGFALPPRIGTLGSELGERLWQFIDANGRPFADFIQRQRGFAYTGFSQTPPVQFHRAAIEKKYISATDKTFLYRTKNGVIVRSKSEMAIANFLHDRGYRFEYERPHCAFRATPPARFLFARL